jgi:hypothetical protein
MLSYFTPAFFWFSIHISMKIFQEYALTKILKGVASSLDQNLVYNSFYYTIDSIYLITICSLVFYSLHLNNNNIKFKPFLYAVSTILGIFSLVILMVLVADIIREI